MPTDNDRDDEREAWNDALASGDEQRITDTQDAVLDRIHRRIMNDPDSNYAQAGWKKDNR